MRYVQLRQEREQGLQSAEHSFQPQFFNAKRAGAVSEYSQKYLRNFHYRGPMPTKIADKTTTARRRPDGYSFQTATYGQKGFKSATSVSIMKVSNYLLVFMLLIYRVGMRRIRANITDRTLQDRYCFNFNGLNFQMTFTVYTTFHDFDISLKYRPRSQSFTTSLGRDLPGSGPKRPLPIPWSNPSPHLQVKMR